MSARCHERASIRTDRAKAADRRSTHFVHAFHGRSFRKYTHVLWIAIFLTTSTRVRFALSPRKRYGESTCCRTLRWKTLCETARRFFQNVHVFERVTGVLKPSHFTRAHSSRETKQNTEKTLRRQCSHVRVGRSVNPLV